MVDAKATRLELTVCERDFEVAQSPGILQSSRAGGTTGAAVWRTSVVFAEWLGHSSNVFFREGILHDASATVELGAGISGILPCLLSPRVQRVIATDQPYILKTLRDNIQANTTASTKQSKKGATHSHHREQPRDSNIDVFPLDWESDDIPSVMSVNGLDAGVDAVLVCDCVFNYALINPLVQTSVDICKLRATSQPTHPPTPTVCVVAQQLRQPEVFEQWLTAFHHHFRTWTIRDEYLTAEMRRGSGFVVHVGILR